ncbi:MAG: hypothetical protein AVDCRST_MAG38-1249, partial [uncultured Solirubrobacteraceae bacterium]
VGEWALHGAQRGRIVRGGEVVGCGGEHHRERRGRGGRGRRRSGPGRGDGRGDRRGRRGGGHRRPRGWGGHHRRGDGAGDVRRPAALVGVAERRGERVTEHRRRRV